MMKPIELAQKYMDCLYKKGDLKELRSILADDLHFKGTFIEHDNADEYIDGFNGEDMSAFPYKMLYTFEKENTVCFVYKLIKPSGPFDLAQVFEIEGERIKKILLIFDGREIEDEDEMVDEDDDWNL